MTSYLDITTVSWQRGNIATINGVDSSGEGGFNWIKIVLGRGIISCNENKQKMKKKRYKMSSDAMEAAEIKNRAEECRRNAMDKIELRHHRFDTFPKFDSQFLRKWNSGKQNNLFFAVDLNLPPILNSVLFRFHSQSWTEKTGWDEWVQGGVMDRH